jgi:hypothetical protein
VKKIKNQAKVNMSAQDQLIADLKKENQRLQDLLANKIRLQEDN